MEHRKISEGGSLELDNSEVSVAEDYLKSYSGDGQPFYLEGNTLYMNDFYVGTLSFPNKVINITPRMDFISFEDLIQIWLLSDRFNNSINSSYRGYSDRKDSFKTALIDRLLGEFETLVQDGKHLTYVESIENKSSIKGKIRPELPSTPGKIKCEFDNLTQNNLPNQIIKQSLTELESFNISKSQEFKINRILTYFEHVDSIKDLNSDIIEKSLRKNDFNNKNYPKVLRLIKLIIDSRLSAKNNDIEYKCFLEDYNELFESFIRNILTLYSDHIVLNQKRSKDYGTIEFRKQKIQKKYEPDLIVENDSGDVIAVGDVKNKYRGSFKKTFFDNSEVFQILFYMNEEDVDLGILVYPSSKTYEPAKMSMKTSEGEIKEIYAIPIPIEKNIDIESRKFVRKFDSAISSSI